MPNTEPLPVERKSCHIGHSLENDTWFVRYYGFNTRDEAESFANAMQPRDARALEALVEAMLSRKKEYAQQLEYSGHDGDEHKQRYWGAKLEEVLFVIAHLENDATARQYMNEMKG